MKMRLFYKTVTIITAAVFFFAGCKSHTVTPNLLNISGNIELTVSGKTVDGDYSYKGGIFTISFVFRENELEFIHDGEKVTATFMGLKSEVSDSAVKTISALRKIFDKASGKRLEKTNNDGLYEFSTTLYGTTCTVYFSSESFPVFIDIPALKINGRFKNTKIQY